MMSEKKFKVGDRVRFVGDSGPWFEHQITKGDEGTVNGKGICDDDVCVSFPMADAVDVSDLELMEPTDPCTAFLQELRELLSKYNATIFGLDMWASINGEQCAFENAEYLDSDNIMDYEKE